MSTPCFRSTFEHRGYVPLCFMLMYICEIYKILVKQKTLYSEKLKMIPTPEFFVIYNGKKEYPDKMILRLSDAFSLQKEEPCLELVVPVYNVNQGHNKELLEQSKALSDYALFVSLVNEFDREGIGFDAAVDKAINYCLEYGIMGAYLENSDEVRKMLITEWNDDEYREVMREEGREEGLVEGREEGLVEGREEGLVEGREEGAENKSLEIARNMKADGEAVDRIAKYTGLSEDAIAAL